MTQGQTRHFFVAGGFCSHPLVQKILTEEFEYKKLTKAAVLMDRVRIVYN